MNEKKLLDKLYELKDSGRLTEEDAQTIQQAIDVIEYIQQTLEAWTDDGR